LDKQKINEAVAASLCEDIGMGDINAELIDAKDIKSASVITREPAIICGIAWFDAVFKQLDASIEITWHVKEGEYVLANQTVVSLKGSTRALLSGERAALNWLQTLSGTATQTYEFVKQLHGTHTKLLDTRKTIPLLREAQKYAVKIGGGQNHRMGLYDAFLIKENHIVACGSISRAILKARESHPEKTLEIEVENVAEFREALTLMPDIIMLDNFDLASIEVAVLENQGRVKLEVSGNVDLANIKSLAQTGVDYISVGALTKNIRAVDLSFRIY
jgi:nicotinate-nucleotide pyrophosphorylase (carboxylating)